MIEKKILQNLSMVKEKIKMGGGFVWNKTFIPGLIFGYFFLFILEMFFNRKKNFAKFIYMVKENIKILQIFRIHGLSLFCQRYFFSEFFLFSF